MDIFSIIAKGKEAEQLADFEKITSELNRIRSIKLNPTKKLLNSNNEREIDGKKVEDLIDEIWNNCIALCKPLLLNKDLDFYIKSFGEKHSDSIFGRKTIGTVVTKETDEISKEYCDILKEHVVFSSYFTAEYLTSKDFKFKDFKKQLREYNDDCYTYTNFNKAYKKVIEYNNNLVDMYNLSNYTADKATNSLAINLIHDICGNWSYCPYNPKFEPVFNGNLMWSNNISVNKPKKTDFQYAYHVFGKFIKKFDKFANQTKNDDLRGYLFERTLHFSLYTEILRFTNNFKEHKKSKDHLSFTNYNNYFSEFATSVENDCAIKELFEKVYIHNKKIAFPKEDYQEFFQCLAHFAILPNAFSRDKIFRFAINLFFTSYDMSVPSWSKDMKALIDSLAYIVFPLCEKIFISLLDSNIKLGSSDKNGKETHEVIEKMKTKLSEYVQKNVQGLNKKMLIYQIGINKEFKDSTKGKDVEESGKTDETEKKEKRIKQISDKDFLVHIIRDQMFVKDPPYLARTKWNSEFVFNKEYKRIINVLNNKIKISNEPDIIKETIQDMYKLIRDEMTTDLYDPIFEKSQGMILFADLFYNNKSIDYTDYLPICEKHPEIIEILSFGGKGLSDIHKILKLYERKPLPEFEYIGKFTIIQDSITSRYNRNSSRLNYDKYRFLW